MSDAHRIELAKAITANGGYSSGYHDRYALSYNVSLTYVDLNTAHIYALAKAEAPDLPPLPDDFEWDAEDEYTWAQENIVRSLQEDDAYRTCSPEVEARYGITEVDAFKVEFGLAGRSGKHLVIESFEGLRLGMRSADLAEAILEEDSDYSDAWCRALLAMMQTWDECFTPKTASAELEHACAFSLRSCLEDQADADRKKSNEQELCLASAD